MEGLVKRYLVRIEGAGTSIDYLNTMSWGVNAVCVVCSRSLPEEERGAIR